MIRKIWLAVLLIATFIGNVDVAHGGVGLWTSNGPEGGNIQALAIDPHTPTTLYAGGGVFKSTNGGASWGPQALPTFTNIFALAIDPATPTTLYAGSWGSGVFAIQQVVSPPTYTLTVTPPGNGTVTGPSVNCPSDCNETYSSGTGVSLTATPASGFVFGAWGWDCAGQGNSCALTMNGPKSVSATFTSTTDTVAIVGSQVIPYPVASGGVVSLLPHRIRLPPSQLRLD